MHSHIYTHAHTHLHYKRARTNSRANSRPHACTHAHMHINTYTHTRTHARTAYCKMMYSVYNIVHQTILYKLTTANWPLHTSAMILFLLLARIINWTDNHSLVIINWTDSHSLVIIVHRLNYTIFHLLTKLVGLLSLQSIIVNRLNHTVSVIWTIQCLLVVCWLNH